MTWLDDRGLAAVTFAVAVSLLAGCNSKPPESFTFKSEAGRFSVVTPVQFKEGIESKTWPLVGTVEAHTFSGDKGTASYSVAYVDYPQEFVNQRDPDKLLDASRDGMIGNVNGKLVLESRISLGANLGRETVVIVKASNGEPATLRARIFLAKNRLYVILVGAPQGELSSDEMVRYLESFTLI